MDHYETRDSYPELEGAKPIDFDKSEIRRIFKGANVFVTGGAGFLGSLLIEKIARSCPDFGKIYLLLRPKRGLTPAQRLEKLFDNEIYDLLKKTNPECASRVFLMEGDLNEPICGLSLDNQNIIREEVNFVYHIAAGLNMAAPLKTAYNMNIRATKDLLDLGTEMKHLKGFIYVSTAYSNCFRPDISEKFYPTTYNWKHLRDLVELMSEEEMSYFTPKLVGEWVNTYAFTKALSEDMVKSYVQKIPVAVARPSIVIGCWMEPLRAWINNVYGAVGVAAGSCVGIIRVWYGDKTKIADVIPADYVVNTMIAIAWQLAKNQQEKVHLSNPVYNIVSSPKAPITWHEYMNQSFKAVYESGVATTKAVGEYSLMVIKQRWLFSILFFILHMCQTLLFDTILILKGKSPMFIHLYIKLMRFNQQLAFFAEREWKCEQNNVNLLLEGMTQEDKTIFPFDMATFSWKEYHVYSIRGVYKYIVKSKDCEQPKAGRDRYFRYVAVRRIIMRIGSLFIWWNVLKVCSHYTTAIIISLSREVSLEKTMIT